MKKIILMSLLLIMLPAHSLCSIDSVNTVCTLRGNDNNIVRPFPVNNGGISDIQKNENQLNPLSLDNPVMQMRNSNNSRNYDSQCQLGNCSQEERNMSISDKRSK